MSKDVAPAVLGISAMSPAELDVAMAWAAREGWNPGASDAECFRATDPQGFLAGRLGDRMVAAISAVRYGSDFAFIGLYIVEPALRGQGLGSQVWEAAMARLRGRTIGLDGVVAMQPAYARSGFMLSHRNIRYAGLPRARKALPAGVEALTMADLAVVERYDEPCFGGPRSGFLAAWLAQPRAVAMGVRSGGDLRGFGVMRPAGSGFKVGPLFADDPDIAGDLLGSIAARIGATAEVFLDVPSPNVEAVALAEGRGMVPSFETARMYAGGDPALPIERIFGVTTFELG